MPKYLLGGIFKIYMSIFISAIFISIGITMEVIWTALVWFFKKRNIKFVGSTSLWMIPLYAITPYMFYLVIKYLPNSSIFLRSLIYLMVIFLLEYIYGWIFKKILQVPLWDYSRDTEDHTGYYCKYNLKGLIALEFTPLWYIVGIIGELIYLYLLSR